MSVDTSSFEDVQQPLAITDAGESGEQGAVPSCGPEVMRELSRIRETADNSGSGQHRAVASSSNAASARISSGRWEL